MLYNFGYYTFFFFVGCLVFFIILMFMLNSVKISNFDELGFLNETLKKLIDVTSYGSYS